MELNTKFYKYVAQTSKAPMALPISHSKGVYLYDFENKAYIDFISGIGVSNLGHNNEAVKQAIVNQVNNYTHLMVYGEFIQAPQVALAEKLVSLLPQNLNSVFFVNSGSEATEGALKLAKRFTGRTEIISCFNAYHGSTHGALSVMGSEYWKNAYRPLLPDVKQIHFNKLEDLELISSKTACVIIETMQGEAGVRVPDFNYMQQLRKRCTETGTLLILDEIQVGMGRTGKLWAFEHFGITPDVLLLAKAFGAGMPLGAFVSSSEIMECLTDNPVLGHITTFGGHPVCCAAALAGLNELTNQNNNIVSNVEFLGSILTQNLKHAKIQEIRGQGLFRSIDLGSELLNKKAIQLCLEKGLITDWFLFCDSALRVAPPLIISENELYKSIEIITEALNQL